ncbi:lipoprotein [Acuticoccus sp. MNP-M23]|uniref:LPS translocon maturation chaperone LptM n=1 Tax=Acuticoccus sp. MNP-M23 TaxID=3072793 RepID=UPI0028153E3B|nr:lipoprotein [Acuticoccus sp. MNP-M23]WMS41029.1 lipoprotein [Acuticoccus sp. MNP-M23]
MIRSALLGALALALALSVAGCGRRGAPESPEITGPTAPVDPAFPQGRQAPDGKFVLDPILQ